MVSNASAWNLVVISLDRYFSVTRPLTYRARRTTRKAAMMIAGAWLLSAVIWLPSVYAWPYIGTVHVLIILSNMVFNRVSQLGFYKRFCPQRLCTGP